MIRSNMSTRRLSALLVAIFAFAVIAPAGAFAQNVSPTDEQYEQGVLGVAAGGSNDPTSGSTADTSGINELPFTGLDVGAVALIGVGLVGAGFVIRRASRNADEQPHS